MLGALGSLLGSRPAGATDPERVWASYLPEFRAQVAVDAAGNVYTAGTTKTPGLATPGAHKDFFELSDVLLMKFDPSGVRVWATYYGGESYEHPYGIAVAGDAVALCGTTRSIAGIASPGAFTTVKPAGEDVAYVAAFSTDGAWQWGTYIGAEGQPGFDELGDSYCGVAIGEPGATYMAASARGDGGLGTRGAHQIQANDDDTNTDAYVVRLGSAGELVWGTYYGGLGEDKATDLARDELGGIYLTGYTSSAGITTPGAFKVMKEGVHDSFLARFDEGGTLTWATYFGGVGNYDFFTAIEAYPGGGVAVAGQMYAFGLGTPGTWQPEKYAEYDAFLARFSPDGDRLWSTYYGGESRESLYSLAVDPVGAIYLGGSTRSLEALTTPNAYQTSYSGQWTGLLAKFNGDGDLLWGTFYGGGSGPEIWPSEIVKAIATWGTERILVSGQTSADTGMATPDAWLQTKPPDDPYVSFVASFTEQSASACATADDCFSSHCVDGVCCDAACGDGANDCQACSQALGASLDGHCSPSAPGTLCRDSTGTCDLAEACSANSLVCPEDQQLADGEPCDGGVCLAGECVEAGSTGDITTTDNITDGTGSTGDVNGNSTSGEAETTTPGETSSTGEPDPTSDTGSVTTDVPATSNPDVPTTGIDTTPSPTGAGTEISSTGSGSGQDEDPGEVDESGCGCATRPAAPDVLLIPLALFALRRRRA